MPSMPNMPSVRTPFAKIICMPSWFAKLLELLLEVGKTQDLKSKIWQTLEDA
jgi:hypothetical protein